MGLLERVFGGTITGDYYWVLGLQGLQGLQGGLLVGLLVGYKGYKGVYKWGLGLQGGL
jgi:hypothetical protein